MLTLKHLHHSYVLLISGVLAFILAACAPPETPAICYRYNFAIDASSSNGDAINIQTGTHVPGSGIQTTNGGDLIANWSEDFFIDWSDIRVDIGRPTGVTGDIQVSFVADAFGVPISVSQTLPADLNAASVYFEDVGANEQKKTFSATVQTSAPLIVGSLTVYIDGANPFPRNDCAPTTNTPPPPLTNTATSTPTATPTPTRTPTPTPTPTPSACEWHTYQATDSRYSGGGVFLQYGKNLRAVAPGTPVTLILDYPVTLCGYVVTFTHNSGATSTLTTSFSNSVTSQSFQYGVGANDDPLCCTNFISRVMSGGQPSFPVNRVTFTNVGSGGWWIDTVDLRFVDIPATPTPTGTLIPSLTPTRTVTPSVTPTITRTPLISGTQPTSTNVGVATRTNVPTSTGTSTVNPSLTPVPPTVQPPPLTWTPPPSQTPQQTLTLLPLPTEIQGTVTPWATYPAPGLTPLPGTPVIQSVVTPIIATGTAPTAGKTAIPVPDDLDDTHGGITGNLQTAVAQVNTMPRDLRVVVPNVARFTEFAGYARYAVSSVSLQEIFGQTLYPIPQHLMYGLVAMMFVSAALLIFRFVMWFLKFANWVIRFVLKIIPFIG